jgi:HEPN domain-containing protein
MDKKLTLSLDRDVIEKAKIYAKSNEVSLSKLIESYLSAVTKEQPVTPEITPLVESLSGVIKLPDDYDEKENYTDYLMEKYK